MRSSPLPAVQPAALWAESLSAAQTASRSEQAPPLALNSSTVVVTLIVAAPAATGASRTAAPATATARKPLALDLMLIDCCPASCRDHRLGVIGDQFPRVDGGSTLPTQHLREPCDSRRGALEDRRLGVTP